ncbi:MAG: signal peptide peptidase SppA [Opitutales bacterium]|nr:signal peptide peptidase SppA [Opitutales bacterium]NRA26076.1 signal peptide peptidase SppA [Opitutales bacterium]
MKSFLFDIIKKVFAYLIASVLTFLIIIGVYAAIIGGVSQGPTVQVNERSFLILSLDRNISDQPRQLTTSDALGQLLSGAPEPLHLYEIITAIDEAKQDSRIAGIFLVGNLVSENYGSSYSAIGEIREALIDFQDEGKSVLGYIENASQIDYYLYSVCTEILANPFGSIQLNGLATLNPYFAGAMDKFGIEAQVVRVGDYKSAIEPYIRADMSEESRAQTQELLASIWETIALEMGDSRGVPVELLDKWANQHGVFEARKALDYGLVDQLLYYDEALQYVGGYGETIQEGRTFEQVEIDDYILTQSERYDNFSDEPYVAVIYAEGDIVDATEPANDIAGDWLARQIRDIRYADELPAAVVLRINSPGGSAYASEVIRREMELLNAEVPVIVSMGGLGASGGYWIATANDGIFVDEATITGSIGVFGLLLNVKEAGGKLGVTFDGVKTHDLGYLYSGVTRKNETEMAVFQESVDQLYGEFIDRVIGSRRDLSRESLEKIAGGRVWSGAQAIELGLADQAGGLMAAIEHAADISGLLSGYRVEEYPKKQTPESFLSGLFTEGVNVDFHTGVTIPKELQEIETLLKSLKRQGKILAKSPITGLE